MLLLSPLFVVAQTVLDSTIAVPKGKTRITFLENLNHAPDVLTEIDTNLTGLQRSFNPGYLHNLGNLGSPLFPLVWEAPRISGFRFGFNQWDFLRLTKSNIGYYNTQNPFTEMQYVQGSEKYFQLINVIHTQNILPNWNIAGQLKREGSQGFYQQQNSRNGNVGFSSWYRSPNRRYLVAGSAIFNNFSFEENGGLLEPIVFDTAKISNGQRNALDMRLNEARQSFEDKDFNIQQMLYFGPTQTKQITSDSDTVSIKLLKPRFYLLHQLSYYKQEYIYTDKSPLSPDSFFYPLVSKPLLTDDTYGFSRLTNKAGVGFMFSDSAFTKNYSLQAYLKYDYIQTQMMRYESVYHNASLGFSGQKTGKFYLKKVKKSLPAFSPIGYSG
ncbi:MAG: hypothetical protein EOP53_01765 [Sphingobacteriales bacterium]|nr:MAG: hypothetical protein EOP53_01765 [Sphingobacteriales bacterium]